MKKLILSFSILFIITFLIVGCQQDKPNEDIAKAPNDWFVSQRAFPYEHINYEARDLAWSQYQEKKQHAVRNFGWVPEGPVNIGGRVSAVAMHANDIETIYVGAASGGVFKTSNGGLFWHAVFDDAMSLSIGDIEIAPSNADVVYVGTGEPNAGGGSVTYDGNGIYRSGDGGTNWDYIGLPESGSIGRIAVHPQDPQTVFVAAMGRLFANNSQRGVFKTTNGGQSWQKVLYLNDSTGGIDIVINPMNPDTVYAALWERVRRPDRRSYGGPGCGIFRSTDGGNTWAEMTNGLPNTSLNSGRIGIDITRAHPNVLYAIYADKIGYFDGVYKTMDGGDSWVRTNDNSLSNVFASFGWWFGRIAADPINPDIAYVIGLDLYNTTNGGASWNYRSTNVHVDQHDLVAHPLNNNYVVLGNDGGVYISENGGGSWTHLENLPITQFYTCEVDFQNPHRLYGGTQDNGTIRTMSGMNYDWSRIYGGDGFRVIVDYSDNDYIYAESQYGGLGRSTNGGYSFSGATNGISGSDRTNWNAPLFIDPLNPQILYFGTNRVYKTTNRAVNWVPISGDLTNGPGTGNLLYGTLTTIHVAASNTNYIYAGTDDGNVWVSKNGGESWNIISASLPERWVTRVAADPHNEELAFVTLSGFRYDSYLPHVFRSDNAGNSWQDISGNLPEAPVNDIIVDPDHEGQLYVATDFGVYVTYDQGLNWHLLGNNLPNVPITDLVFHQPTRTLIAASYGRSMYSFELDQMVSIGDMEVKTASKLKIYPNPAKEKIIIDDLPTEGSSNFSVLTMAGQEVLSGEINNDQPEINIENLTSGAYVLRITNKGKIFSARFIRK